MHTKGNWSRGKLKNTVVTDSMPQESWVGDYNAETVGAVFGGYIIAYCVNPQDIPLVAAAPELLKELKNLMDFVGELYWSDSRERIYALIAKAEGRAED